MDPKKCEKCRQYFVYDIKPDCIGPYCEFARALLEDIEVCLKEMPIEKIRASCERFIPKIHTGKIDRCYLDPERCFICWVGEVGDLLTDIHFKLRGDLLTEKGREHNIHEK